MKTYTMLLSKSRCVCMCVFCYFSSVSFLRFIFIRVFDCLYIGTPTVFIVTRETPKRESDRMLNLGPLLKQQVFFPSSLPSFFFPVSPLKGCPYVILTNLQLFAKQSGLKCICDPTLDCSHYRPTTEVSRN